MCCTRLGKAPTRLALAACLLTAAATAGAQTTPPQESPINDEYRITAFPTHPLVGPLTGFGYLGYINAAGKDTTTYYVGWPGVVNKPAKWLEAWGGLLYYRNDVANGSDTREFRPFLGGKVYIPNRAHVNLYNFTRVEDRSDPLSYSDNVFRMNLKIGITRGLLERLSGAEPE